MADAVKNKEWIKLGAIKKGKTGNNYIAFGTPKSKFGPVNVELVVKDLTGKVLATIVNPNVNVQNPRKRPGITPEQAALIPEYLLADLSLPPAKD
jgi:hypothetical protein